MVHTARNFLTHPPTGTPRRAISLGEGLLCSTSPQRSRQTGLQCAHRTSTVSSCAFCEQEGWSGDSFPIPPSSLASLSWNGTRVGPTAAVERAHSDRARSGSKGSARVPFHPFHRGGSASKKGPGHPSPSSFRNPTPYPFLSSRPVFLPSFLPVSFLSLSACLNLFP